MTTAEVVTAVLVALGGGAIIPKIIEGFRAWSSGRAKEEKQQNQSLLTRVINAERRFDMEAEFRRAWEEHAARLKRLLIQVGVPEDKLPAEPTRKDR